MSVQNDINEKLLQFLQTTVNKDTDMIKNIAVIMRDMEYLNKSIQEVKNLHIESKMESARLHKEHDEQAEIIKSDVERIKTALRTTQRIAACVAAAVAWVFQVIIDFVKGMF